MKRKILIISPSIEDGSVRGLGRVNQAIINGALNDELEPILLTGAPLKVRKSGKSLGKTILTKRQLDHYLLDGIHSNAFSNSKIKIATSIMRDLASVIFLKKKNFVRMRDEFYKHLPEALKNYAGVYGVINISYIFRVRKFLPNRIMSFLILRLSRRNGIDAIITTSPFPIKRPILFNKGIKIIQYVHDIMPLNILETVPGSGENFLADLSVAYKYSDAVIASSKSTTKKINKLFSSDKAELLYLPFQAYDTEQKIINNSVLDNYGVRKNNYLVCVSVIESRKNVARLIRAFSISAARKNYKLVLIGDKGMGYQEVQDIYASLPEKIAKRIVFTDYIRETEKSILISSAKALVHPSVDEGLGIPVIEGVINHKPVLATRLESIEEFAPSSSVVYINNPYDMYEIASKMDFVTKVKTSRSQSEKNSLEVAETFSVDKFNKILKKILT